MLGCSYVSQGVVRVAICVVEAKVDASSGMALLVLGLFALCSGDAGVVLSFVALPYDVLWCIAILSYAALPFQKCCPEPCQQVLLPKPSDLGLLSFGLRWFGCGVCEVWDIVNAKSLSSSSVEAFSSN
ncbi:hypothetical protein U1Q18_029289 [Sarracenia purpurea var. burkii]